MTKISNQVLDVLNDSRIENNVLFLPGTQLERKLYLEVNKVLETIGGKWNKKTKGHIFDSDVDELINEMINTGEYTDIKKVYQFYPTPLNILRQMIELADLRSGDTVLEPSAGDGAIVAEILKITHLVVAIELNRKCCKELEKILNESRVLNHDFLEAEPAKVYNKIIMNPPFSKQQDIDHILHAFKFLKPGGTLVSIVSEAPFFRENKKSIDFRNWLAANHAINYILPEGAFKESGTMVKTRIIKIHS